MTGDIASCSTLFHYIGLFVVVKICFKVFSQLFDYIKCRVSLTKLKDFKGQWAVVTGSTDGIGKSLAKCLAQKGIDIVLISRTESKLKDTATEIENEFHVRTHCIQADFTDRNCYGKITEEIEKLDIGILVNNVGMVCSNPTPYTSLSTDFLWNELDVNCGSTVMMTRIVLPQMKKNKKGIILNVSSLSTVLGFPYVGNYAATKNFINMFSLNIKEEVAKYNIQVHCLIPALVRTKLVDVVEPLVKKTIKMMPITRHLFPYSQTYAESAINSLFSGYAISTGYWGHTLLEFVCFIFPLEIRTKIIGMAFVHMGKYNSKNRKE